MSASISTCPQSCSQNLLFSLIHTGVMALHRQPSQARSEFIHAHPKTQSLILFHRLATLADTYGYIMIFPNSPNTADSCWDVSSNATLTHNGGGDSLGIVSMVKYVLANYNADPNRVFSMGTSSGAMMTNVLLGAYPDIFAAGSAWAGVPFGCFADSAGGVDVWNSACATGTIIKTGAQWAAIVNAAYPGYTGYRPKMQVFHGTADTTLYPQNLQEEIKEWTSVLGLPSSPISTLSNSPDSGWSEFSFCSSPVDVPCGFPALPEQKRDAPYVPPCLNVS